MRGPPDPEMRSPAVTSGRANRKSSKPSRLRKNEYASGSVIARLAVAPNGILIGSFKSRLEAAKAFSEVSALAN